jgi:hypothetical protein
MEAKKAGKLIRQALDETISDAWRDVLRRLADELDPPVVAPEGWQLTGECRRPKEGEWYLDDVNGAPYKAERAGWDFKNTYHHILRKIEPEYQPGELVVVDVEGAIYPRYVCGPDLLLLDTDNSISCFSMRQARQPIIEDFMGLSYGEAERVLRTLQARGKSLFGKAD